jgi:steroid delta-isomerase
MATEDQMRTAFEQYVERLSAGDGDAVAALYADDAWMEDPIGSPRKEGRAAIAEFYRAAIERAAPQVRLSGPVCTSSVDAAAAPLQSRSTFNGVPSVIDIIDIFTFDDEGRITTMRAIFGPANVQRDAVAVDRARGRA